MKTKILSYLGLMGIGLASQAWGDVSNKIYSAQTGSYYQLIYDGAVYESKYFPDALKDCKARSGHLATITSKAENDFINQQFYNYNSSYANDFWIGATDEAVEGQYKWVTGEPWNFTAWASGEPYSGYQNYDYVNYNASSTAGAGNWNTTNYNRSNNYLCEWESNYPLATTNLFDMTGDSKAELGVLKLVKGVRTVRFLNPMTGSAVGITLTFGSTASIENSFIAPVSNMGGSTKPEVAIMFKINNGNNVVYIKDSTNNATYLKSFVVASNDFDILSMTSIADLNGNGVSELQFLAKSRLNNASSIMIFDPKLGTKIKTLTP